MSVDIDSVKNFIPIGSVVNSDTPLDDIVDKNQPLTYVQWLPRVRLTVTGSTDMTHQYNRYLRQWASTQDNAQTTENIVLAQYKTLIKDISLNYTTSEEKRFLSNLNYDDPRHVESAIPFFANKIKQISSYYTRERDLIKQQKIQSASSGSTAGVSRATRNKIAQKVSSPETTDDTSGNLNIDYSVNLIALYDIHQGYFTQSISPITTNTFNTTENIIAQAVAECAPVLNLSDRINIVLTNTSTTQQEDSIVIQNTNYSEFFNYIKEENNLNALQEPVYINTILGSSLMQLSGGELSYTTTPSKPWRNMFNRYTPAINTTKNTSSEYKTIQELGGYNVPKNLGILTYYSKSPVPMTPSATVDLLPDLNKYGSSNIPTLSGLNITHAEDITWLKADNSNGRLFGDIVSDKSTATFTGYTSRDELNGVPATGISRSTDNFGYFSGKKKNKWSNKDIFPEIANNVFDIDTRTDKLLTGHQTLHRWRTDIFGNEYALYKQIQPARKPLDQPRRTIIEDEIEFVVGCQVLDGGDSLLERPGIYSPDVNYDIYEGGRSPGVDSKFEQSFNPRPFKDLRRNTGVDGFGNTVLEDHNSWYVGIDPSPNRIDDSIALRPITFHGFRPDPVYDEQAYGGLFTDTACGVVDPSTFKCEVIDNYAYNDSSEQITGGGFYVSRNAPANDVQDTFEVYLNGGEDQTWEELAFADGVGVEGVVHGGRVDGSMFGDTFCENETGDFEYGGTGVSYFNHELTTAKTTYSDDPTGDPEEYITTYNQNNTTPGTMYFRSYNDLNQSEISVALSDVIGNFNFFDNSDHDKVFDDITTGNIIDMDVIYDNLLILTPTHMLIEKINFDPITSKLKPNNTTNVLLRTTYDDDREKSMGWFFNENTNKLLTGHTSVSGDVVFPRIFEVDLKSLEYRQVFPDMRHNDDVNQFSLTGELSGYKISTVDTPIIKFNEKVNEYNISFSATLSGESAEIYAIVTSDYRADRNSMKLNDAVMYHGEAIQRFLNPQAEWEDKITTRTIRLEGPETLQPSQPGEIKTKTLSLSSMTGFALSSLEFELEVENYHIPVDTTSYRVIQLVMDPGDGSDVKTIDRVIDDGTGGLDVDITTIPDPSDFGDPRIQNFTHQYNFNKQNTHTYTAQISAIYSDFSVLVFKINIETEPYTIQSAFGSMKLIESKPYLDTNNEKKQLLVLETEQPRYVANVVIDR